VLYITECAYGTEKAEEVEAVMETLPIEWVDVDRELTRAAARFKVDGSLAYADCFAAGLARRTEGEVVTGDPEFEAVSDQVNVWWLTSGEM
jgi:predicted nucleic acid-binding protein